MHEPGWYLKKPQKMSPFTLGVILYNAVCVGFQSEVISELKQPHYAPKCVSTKIIPLCNTSL